MRRRLLLAAPVLLAAPAVVRAQERVLNLYSSRHYDTDRVLYEGFTAATGNRVRLIEGDADQLLARIQAEGANSPADVLMAVDAAPLQRAVDAGVLAPTESAVLAARVPAGLRAPGGEWFAVSRRARVLMYDKRRGVPAGLARYEDLAKPDYRGQILVRAAAHPYNTSLMSGIIAANGTEAAEAWARGVAANLARPPQGGDRPQFEAVAAGQGSIAIANTYYLARYGASGIASEQAVYDKLGVLFPNQADRGAHVSVCGAGVVKSGQHREAGRAFLEYLVSRPAQELFTNGNFEYPVAPDVEPHPALAAFGSFRADDRGAQVQGALSAQALQIMQRAGWR
ncbi:extracellular solute-binding protein [Plastoroseomonas arctica]|uniref:Extracellular solute-binding protein n=1 Tax=Plastoroseomonas arctica TaxID=1509237 RepID=A0AAF1JZT3_9PROT|nr:extracellular solute-binding protein [Plastoroseomonas arctica]MBR0656123.1 extracellular solute-binding protein [Plastoroseomonas arctica]